MQHSDRPPARAMAVPVCDPSAAPMAVATPLTPLSSPPWSAWPVMMDDAMHPSPVADRMQSLLQEARAAPGAQRPAAVADRTGAGRGRCRACQPSSARAGCFPCPCRERADPNCPRVPYGEVFAPRPAAVPPPVRHATDPVPPPLVRRRR